MKSVVVAYAAIISIAVKNNTLCEKLEQTALDHSTRTNIAKNFPLRLPQYDHEHFPTQPYVRIKYSATIPTDELTAPSVRNTATTDENILPYRMCVFHKRQRYTETESTARNVPVTVYFIYLHILLSLAFLYHDTYNMYIYILWYTVVDCFETVRSSCIIVKNIPRSMRADCNATVCFELYDYYCNLRSCRDDGLLLIMYIHVCVSVSF